ncbi:hypothetical protein [Candidatus Hodarchaeum mangrovi]
MPIDKSKLDDLLEEIKRLEEEKSNIIPKTSNISLQHRSIVPNSMKKEYLLRTEKKAFFIISHYYKLTMLSLEDPGVALEIWIKGILPYLLLKNGLDNEEWERLCIIEEENVSIAQELNDDWKNFFRNTIKKGLVDEKVLELINEGKVKIERIRSS